MAETVLNRFMGLLNNLRFPLSLIVVGIHVFSLTESYHPSSESVCAVKNIFESFFAPLAVPCFFFISGYYFFKNFENRWSIYLNKLNRRFHHLLIPYIIWNLLVLLKIGFIYGWDTARFTPETIINIFFDRSFSPFGDGKISDSLYPMNIPLWYIRDLMFCTLLSPVIFFLTERMRAFVLLFLCILFVSGGLLHGYWSQFTCSISLFGWGGYFSVFKKDIVLHFKSLFYICLIIYGVLGFIKFSEVNFVLPSMIVDKIQILSGVALFVNLSFFANHMKLSIPNFLSQTTYFVFLSHYLFYQESFKCLYRVIPQTFFLDAITYILGIVLTYIVSVTLYKLMEQLCQPILHILVGSYYSYGKH